MVLLVVVAIVGMLGAWLLPSTGDWHRAAHVHLAFALGVMPLIMGAMTHFIPVLTRTRAAPRSVEGYAGLAWLGGVLIVAFFMFALLDVVRSVAAFLALVAAGGLAVWQLMRAGEALGGAHPGLRWYVAALVCLAASLLAVLAMSVWPQQFLALKRFHLHLNLFGFVGLTAIGTLQVLLPTAVGHPDPQVSNRLRADLHFAFFGSVLIAGGAAWLSLLSWLGLLLWMIPLGRLMRAWFAGYRAEIFRWHGAVPLVAAALAGFFIALVAGGGHALGWLDSTGLAHLFVFSFLFPLVSGAAGQLLPLWLRPGQQTEWHTRARLRLTFASGTRAALFLGAGLLALAGFKWASWLALAALLSFALAVVSLLRLPR
ncbi:hypothetical protein [Sideroxydans lithotrophicus]|uniref:NnrS family protein n=1 Tax=Sideroxydans lithotrophicus (strain ES-1) TaxID=580332 RepID=D5CQX2_SIDLE|nr:hypothetical protein [Sideroxydans lithotrophicus]ADE11358.1 conserved hypothetical protein [Sideroxydans lithotrophicus ES-1]